MKRLLPVLAILCLSYSVSAQTVTPHVKVGDVLTINKTSNLPFQYILFPKGNFIIKRGGIANYKGLHGQKVKVVAIDENNQAKLVSMNGKRFFNIYNYVKADLTNALVKQELQYVNL